MPGYGLPSGIATSYRPMNYGFGGGISMNDIYQARRQAELDNLDWAETQRDWETQDRRNAQAMAGQANQFLNSWLSDLDKVGGMYDSAIASVDDISAMADTLGEEYDSFQNQYGQLENDLINASGTDLENRNIMAQQFMDASKADYGGATRKALADVSQQSQQARDAMGRSMAGMGISQNSGNYMAGLRQSYLDEAKNKALAMNTARNNEATRAANLAATGMQAFDPSNTAGLALGIQSAGNDLLTTQAGLSSQAAGSLQSIADSYANNVASAKGDLAGTLTGLVASNGANPFTLRR